MMAKGGSRKITAHLTTTNTTTMPHIIVDGCNTDLNIQQIRIHAEVTFSQPMYTGHRSRCQRKLAELQEKLEAVVNEYFDGYYEADNWLDNHSYNLHGAIMDGEKLI